jgi:hypothetical protein
VAITAVRTDPSELVNADSIILQPPDSEGGR